MDVEDGAEEELAEVSELQSRVAAVAEARASLYSIFSSF